MQITRSKATFPFCDLPLELRNKIYGYLLSTKHTKVDLTYHKQFPSDSLPVLIPSHRYCFHTGILLANRQINSEAADVFYRKNLFVSVTYIHPEFDAKLAGMVVVATGLHASNFKNYYMEVHLSARWDGDHVLPRRHEQVIIAGEDVSQFCDLLPGLRDDDLRPGFREPWASDSINFYIRITIKRISGDENANDDTPMAKRLLEPFRRFYGIRVYVEGHVTSSYKEQIAQCPARQVPTATDLISMVCKTTEEGNEAKQTGDLDTALTKYESALNLMRLGCVHLISSSLIGNIAEFYVIFIELISLLASTYLEFGEPSKSYRCAQELYMTKPKVEWYRNSGIPVLPDLARIMLCKALAGKALGQPAQALMDLDIALEILPADEKLKEERKVLCGLVREEMNNEVQMKWVCALGLRRKNLKKDQRVALRWNDLEALIEDRYFG